MEIESRRKGKESTHTHDTPQTGKKRGRREREWCVRGKKGTRYDIIEWGSVVSCPTQQQPTPKKEQQRYTVR